MRDFVLFHVSQHTRICSLLPCQIIMSRGTRLRCSSRPLYPLHRMQPAPPVFLGPQTQPEPIRSPCPLPACLRSPDSSSHGRAPLNRHPFPGREPIDVRHRHPGKRDAGRDRRRDPFRHLSHFGQRNRERNREGHGSSLNLAQAEKSGNVVVATLLGGSTPGTARPKRSVGSSSRRRARPKRQRRPGHWPPDHPRRLCSKVERVMGIEPT